MATESQKNLSAVQISQHRDGILLVTLDLPDKSANVLSSTFFDQLETAMIPLMDRDDISGLILYSAKPKIFVAGADLNEIVAGLDWPDEPIIKFCERGRSAMAMFNRCPFPTIAAIHGACVGGGLELALWCDGRVVTNDRRSVLGLPEVKLGLIPGWAGTVRVARLCGLEKQLELVTSGKLISGAEASDIGLVNAVVEQAELLDQATQWLESEFESGNYLSHRSKLEAPLIVSNANELEHKFSNAIADQAENQHPFAPSVALEHMLRAAMLPMKEACDSESVAFATAWGSDASYGLLNNFFLGEHNRRQPGFVDTKIEVTEVSNVGIVGAGVMGVSIAKNNLQRRKQIRLLDANQQLASDAAKELQKSGNASSVTEYSGFADCDLVIESVVETLDVKTSVIKKIEAAVADETLIASNTSAIAISKLAESLTNPDRFCGIHFCHPELMSLVEVICGKETSESTMASGVAYVRSLGKMPIAINDCAGFVVNRLLAAMIDSSVRLLTQGVPLETIDHAMREFGFKGGPFEIMDVIGVDTCMYAGRSMWENGLKCVTLSPVLPRLVKLGRLGRKTGVGFYSYPNPREERIYDPEIENIVSSYLVSEPTTKMDSETIALQILSPVVREATLILDQGIVADHRDIDLAIIHGFSFPSHRGGLLFWVDRIGLAKVNATLEQLGKKESRLIPTERMFAMQEQARKFYE